MGSDRVRFCIRVNPTKRNAKSRRIRLGIVRELCALLRYDRVNDLAFDFLLACLGSLRNCVERCVVVGLLSDLGNQFGVGDFAVSVNDNHSATQKAFERSVD